VQIERGLQQLPRDHEMAVRIAIGIRTGRDAAHAPQPEHDRQAEQQSHRQRFAETRASDRAPRRSTTAAAALVEGDGGAQRVPKTWGSVMAPQRTLYETSSITCSPAKRKLAMAV
jgi:hypothetical protein